MKRLLLLGLLLLPLSGCYEPPPPIQSIQPIDSSRVAAVEASLKSDPVLAGCVIKVTAVNGLLVIDGEVPTNDAKARAESIAGRIDGVKKIANHLVVKPTDGDVNQNTDFNGGASPQPY